MNILDTTVIIDIDRGGSEILKKAKKLSPEGVRDYAQKLKSESEEMHVKEGIVYTVGEYDCTQCKKHCVIKCNGKTHWIE